ncbi:MAG: hypothetical protein NVS3B20_12080 [Polyangiales bacterium]
MTRRGLHSEPPRSRRLLGRSAALGVLTFAAREIAATLRVVASTPGGLRGKAHAGAHACDDLVILVHGLMATAGTFSPAVRHLRTELEVDVRTFTFFPGSTLDSIAARIDRAVRAHPKAARVHLIGHSLGGLAARWHVQTMAHDPRIVQTISIASPFMGMDLADLLPNRVRALMLPLPFQLERMVADAKLHLARVPHLSIIADKDQLIRPVTTGILPGAPSYVLHDTGHNGSLFHPKILEVLVREIERYVPGGEGVSKKRDA